MLWIDCTFMPDLEEEFLPIPEKVREVLESDESRCALIRIYDDESGHSFIEAVSEQDFSRLIALLPPPFMKFRFVPDQQFTLNKDELIDYLTLLTPEDQEENLWRMMQFLALAQSDTVTLTTLFCSPYHIPEDEEPQPIMDCYSPLPHDTYFHLNIFVEYEFVQVNEKPICAR